MQNKLFRSIFSAIMTVFSLCMILVLSVVYKNFTTMYWEQLKQESAFLCAIVEEEGFEMLEGMQRVGNSRITYMDANGEVLFDSVSDARLMENHKDREEVKEAIEKGIGTSTRYSFTQSEKNMNYAVLLKNGYILRVSTSEHHVFNLIVEMIFPIVLILAIAIAVSLIWASRVSKSIIQPILTIDLDNPDERDVYAELRPFIGKIHAQNRQIQRQMEEMKLDHEKQDNIRKEFTANVSHELRTPLTSISGIAEIISEGLVRQEDIPHFAANIYKESQRLIVLVNDIMELSRLEENGVTKPKEPVDIYVMGQEILERLRRHAQKKQVTLLMEGEACTIMGRPKIMDEMIFNLVDNAIKYNEENGQVKLFVGRKNGKITINVKDTGIGIPEEELERVFERFYRVDKSHSKEIGGTGLGLSIVKHGAKFHNASVEIESKVGVGTSISIVFPETNE